jgi:enamine deaminase RidA (YjgF/YER057c/UK114 family)
MLTYVTGSLWETLDANVPGVEIARCGWGSKSVLSGISEALDIPSLWLCGPDGGFPPILQRIILPKGVATPVIYKNRVVATKYETLTAEYLLIMGVLPEDLTASRKEQASQAFEALDEVVQSAGFTFDHVVRTWLYMDRILEWYDELNDARDAFFEKKGIFTRGFIPASTGIGVGNTAGAAMAIGALAIRSKPTIGKMTVQMVDSPLQCSALAYRKSFSRAVEIDSPQGRTLLISGTASIEPGGETIHVGDPEKQIELTMEVVKAILESRGMDFSKSIRAIAYIKRPEYRVYWQQWLKKNNLPSSFAEEVYADVCRDDLLFELELDAFAAK